MVRFWTDKTGTIGCNYYPFRIWQHIFPSGKIDAAPKKLSMRLPSYLRTDLLHQSVGLDLVKERLISLNSILMKKMLAHEDIQESVEKSLNIIPLNSYPSPLDTLLEKLTD